MAILQIRTLGDPVLRERCRPLERFDAWLRATVEDMIETMHAAPGVGLAANQVGVPLRFFVYDDGEGHQGFVANPELFDLDAFEEIDEGCLSIPGPFHPTRRALRCRLRGQDLDGRPIEIEAEGLLARIFQHETDHLDGKLYIDRLDAAGRREVLRQLRELELKRVQGG
ncbi:MAG: peptide deformylase [Actinomycetota bacterium]|nr:MAG: peptide deformylase [Actinomycetota bacterium]